MANSILVTGCAGFIGARVVQMLTEQGHQVVGIDNLNDYYDVSLKQYRLDAIKDLEGFEFRKLDLEDGPGIEKLFDEFEIESVINLAARAGVRYSMANPHIYLSTNAMGNLNLLESMRKREIKKYVLASTSSLYAGHSMPFTEDLDVSRPLSSYAASKKAAEVMAFSHHHLYDIDVSICRYFTVYGPAGRPDMSPFRFIRWIDEGIPIELFGDGTQARDFTYVDDIAKGTIAALKPVGYEIFNLGGGKDPVSINTMIEKMESLLGKKAKIDYKPFHKTDMMTTWADNTKAARMLDWTPHISLDDGLEQTVNWHLDNQPWSNNIELP